MSNANAATVNTKGTEEVADDDKLDSADQTGLFADEASEDAKVLKFRALFKGPALAALLKVVGGTVVPGDKQDAYVVPSAGGRELGDVLRALFQKAGDAGVTLSDIVALIKSKAAK